MSPMRHAQHDEIAAVARGWSRQAFPEMGWRYAQLSAGAYRWHDTDRERSWAWVTADPTVDDARALVAAVAAETAGWPSPRIRIDRAAQHARLAPGLASAGYRRTDGQAMLAYTGALPRVEPVPGVEVRDVGLAELAEWSATKLRAFSGDDAEPDPAALERERSLRQAEAGGAQRLRLARLGGEPIAVLGWYAGEDVDVYNLATRLGFRNRGIARMLLTRLMAESLAAGARSVLIGTDVDDTPIRWYRRLGFTDLLFVQWTYEPPR